MFSLNIQRTRAQTKENGMSTVTTPGEATCDTSITKKLTANSNAPYVSPPENNYYLAAARRSLKLFDWIGHGRNLAKMQNDPVRKAQVGKRPQCGKLDSQNHCMLTCDKDIDLDCIRRAARIKQDAIAHTLLKKHTKLEYIHFIR